MARHTGQSQPPIYTHTTATTVYLCDLQHLRCTLSAAGPALFRSFLPCRRRRHGALFFLRGCNSRRTFGVAMTSLPYRRRLQNVFRFGRIDAERVDRSDVTQRVVRRLSLQTLLDVTFVVGISVGVGVSTARSCLSCRIRGLFIMFGSFGNTTCRQRLRSGRSRAFLVVLQQVVEAGLKVGVKVVVVVVEDFLTLHRLQGAEIEVLVEIPAVDVSPAEGSARVESASRVQTVVAEPAEPAESVADTEAVGVEVESPVVGADCATNQGKGVVVVVVVVGATDTAAARSIIAKQPEHAAPRPGTAPPEVESVPQGVEAFLSVLAGRVGAGEVAAVACAATAEARA